MQSALQRASRNMNIFATVSDVFDVLVGGRSRPHRRPAFAATVIESMRTLVRGRVFDAPPPLRMCSGLLCRRGG
jgi:hypothetical protein